MGQAKVRKQNDPMYGHIPKGVKSIEATVTNGPKEKFLYLTELEWANTWIAGGEVPINLASAYLSNTRDGIMTPDENRIHRSPVDLTTLRPAFHFENVKNITIIDSSINGKPIPNIFNADYYTEDGLILSFCNEFNGKTAKRLRKKACVKILDIDKLKADLDRQLGVVGRGAICEYTKDHQRSHFLKSTGDAWQNEFRLFWPVLERKLVVIPPGTGELVGVFTE